MPVARIWFQPTPKASTPNSKASTQKAQDAEKELRVLLEGTRFQCASGRNKKRFFVEFGGSGGFLSVTAVFCGIGGRGDSLRPNMWDLALRDSRARRGKWLGVFGAPELRDEPPKRGDLPREA